MKRVLIAAVVVVGLVAGAAHPSPPPAQHRDGAVPVPSASVHVALAPDPSTWSGLAQIAWAYYAAAPAPTVFRAQVYGQALEAVGHLYGWQDSRVQPLIAQLMAIRTPDGGWGIDSTRGAFNGATNAATTSYTVTMTDHVGRPLLDAYEHGVLTNTEPLQTITKLLMAEKRMSTSAGLCLPYSTNANDYSATVASYCIPNINASAASYLMHADANGFGATGLQTLVQQMTQRTVADYNPTWGGWPYQENGSAIQDPDHNAFTAQSMMDGLGWVVGRNAGYGNIIKATASGDDDEVRGHMLLVSQPDGLNAHATDGTARTSWCQYGEQWKPQIAAYLANHSTSAQNMSQAAARLALDAEACPGA